MANAKNDVDTRRAQLEQLAAEGDECARADLFREYGVDYDAGVKEASHDR